MTDRDVLQGGEHEIQKNIIINIKRKLRTEPKISESQSSHEYSITNREVRYRDLLDTEPNFNILLHSMTFFFFQDFQDSMEERLNFIKVPTSPKIQQDLIDNENCIQNTSNCDNDGVRFGFYYDSSFIFLI